MIGEIVDIRLLNGQMLVLKENPITSQQVEKTILTIPYKGQGLIKDEQVEKTRFPSIAQTFYRYLFLFGVPTPEELISLYFKQHFILNDTHARLTDSFDWYAIDGIKARIYRTYPSLLRDFHFYLLCHESGHFEKVYYSLQADFKEGIDVRLTYHGQDYAVACFVETKRSQSYKQDKYQRHKPLTIPEIKMEINPFDRSNYIGDYALYRPTHIHLLLERIQQHIPSSSLTTPQHRTAE